MAPKYDLEERTAKFGQDVIRLVRKIRADHISKPIISQLIRSSTSIGANYMEASGGESRNDFMHKCFICRKEANESRHFLKMLLAAEPEINVVLLQKEAQELVLIFSAITRKK